ncbi:MAG: hypothetical protein JWQ52_926 [Phenylobacterium sp.]|nr:hypothetical protein [Phenylobacterium sp.]
MSLDIAAQKKRLMTMGVVNAVSVAVALAAIVGFFKAGLDWALLVFAAALIVGFGAQIWFIAGLRRAKEGV